MAFKPMNREDFQSISDVDTKLNILFFYIVELGNKLDDIKKCLGASVECKVEELEERIEEKINQLENHINEEINFIKKDVQDLKRKNIFHKTLSAISGFIGGFIAGLTRQLTGWW